MTFDDALNNARGVGVMSGEQIEREYTAGKNQHAPVCDQGHPTTYRAPVGAYRCAHGALVRTSGAIVRGCRG